jgi:MFS family permease
LSTLIDIRHAADARGAERTSSRRGALAGLALATLLAALGTSATNVALPTFARAFGASFPAVQWIVLAYLLAVTALVVGAGRLGDIVGRRRLLLVGIAMFTGASVLCGVAPSLWALIAARAAQGVGAAVMLALPVAIIGGTVPAERAGRAVGLLGTASAIGTALGPSLGGALIAAAGWRAVFLVNVPLGVAALWLTHRHLPAGGSGRAARRRDLDAAGTVLLAAALGAYALAMTIGRGRFGAVNVALLAGGAVAAMLFARAEARAPAPLVRLSLLGRRALVPGLAANALVASVMITTLVVGPFYLGRALALPLALVGIVMSVGPLVTAVGGVPAGRLVDRIGTRRATRAGLRAVAAGAALLALFPASLGVAGYVGPLAVVTGGYALFQTANTTAVMAGIPTDERGVVAGLLGLARNLGLVTGASAMGAVFARASGASDVASAPPDAIAAGMRLTFAAAAALAVVALAITSRRRVGRATTAAMLLVLATRRRVQTPTPADPDQVVNARAAACPEPLRDSGGLRRVSATMRLM